MKTLVLLLVLVLTSCYRYNSHNRHRLKHKSKFHFKILLKAISKSMYHSNSRKTHKVSLHNLNMKALDKKKRINDGQGDIMLNTNNLANLYFQCQTAAGSGNDNTADKLFADYVSRAKRALEQIGSKYLQEYWIYYVDSKGNCDIQNEEADIQFMLIPAGDPREINFNNPNYKIGFIKICLNGNKQKNNFGWGLPSNLADEVVQTDDKKNQKRLISVNVKSAIKSNINSDDSKPSDGYKQISIRKYVEQKYPAKDKETIEEQKNREYNINSEIERLFRQSDNPYLLRYCAFDSCAKTSQYMDIAFKRLENNERIKGDCDSEINDDESIVIENDSEDKSKFSVVNKNQCDSLGRLEYV